MRGLLIRLFSLILVCTMLGSAFIADVLPARTADVSDAGTHGHAVKNASWDDDDTGDSPTMIFDGADVNGDGKVNGLDLIRLRKYIMQTDHTDPADIRITAIPPDATGLKKER